MLILLVAPLILQGFLILIDEIFFHYKRGLPTWEVWGHPLDTFSVALVFAIAAFTDYPSTTIYFWVAAFFSTLLVTKDEFVHAEVCSGGEHWLHAVLFILHPISFFAAWVLWKEGIGDGILRTQVLLLVTFMVYQILFWGIPWQRQKI